MYFSGTVSDVGWGLFGHVNPFKIYSPSWVDHNEKNNLAFGVLKVTRIVEQAYANIDDQLAHVENFPDAESLKDELRLIYPSIEEESRIRVFYFANIHMMDQKLQG